MIALVLRPERDFYLAMLIYAIAISALSVSVPLSVQMLIGTVVNTAVLDQVLVLALLLLLLLGAAATFMALQYFLMELFERRFFARVLSEVALRLLYASPGHMQRIDRGDLVNRYFDIMTVQKNLPQLLTGGLAALLQTAVGFVLTAVYHPLFIIFNAAIALMVYLLFRLFDRAAARTGLALSNAKYQAANWLETLARVNSAFKSRRAIDFALTRTGAVRSDYTAAHRSHFKVTFLEVIGFLALYAFASAALLGLGGWLIVIGQLTVGQLVAAELILAAVFYGLTRAGYYLELYYELYAALAKLLQLYSLPVERIRSGAAVDVASGEIGLHEVRVQAANGAFCFDAEFAHGSINLLLARSSTQVTLLTDLLLGHSAPDTGHVFIGGLDVDDYNVQALRDAVHVIDALPFPACSIADYLDIAAPGITRARIRELLYIVGLEVEPQSLRQDVDVPLTPDGYPLSSAGVVKLKIAYALAATPRVLVLTPLFDLLSQEARRRIVEWMRAERAMTVLCFTHRREPLTFDRFVLLDFESHTEFTDLDALFAAYAALLPASAPEGTGT